VNFISQRIMDSDIEFGTKEFIMDTINESTKTSFKEKFFDKESLIVELLNEQENNDLECDYIPTGMLVLGFIIMNNGLPLSETTKLFIKNTININSSDYIFDKLSSDFKEERIFYLEDFNNKIDSYNESPVEFSEVYKKKTVKPKKFSF